MSLYGHSFTFDGIDVEDLGLYYAPDVKGNNTYVWHPATPKILEQSFEARDGGLYYGRSLGPKEFTLRCFYEQTPQEEGLLNKVYRHFEIGKRGKLSFELRPWLDYNVIITNVDINTMYNFQNGLVTITCKAYKPYAVSNIKYNTYDKTSYDYMIVHNNSNIWDSGDIVYPDQSVTGSITSTGTYAYIYNPGDCNANTILYIKYTANNVLNISNTDGLSNCKLEPVSSAIQLIVNGETGKVYDYNSELQFKYHRAGFLKLAPNKYLKDTTLTVDGTTVTSSRDFTTEEKQWLAKGYAYNGTDIVKISSVGTNTVTLSGSITGTIKLLTLNKIFVQCADGAEITQFALTFDYKFE